MHFKVICSIFHEEKAHLSTTKSKYSYNSRAGICEKLLWGFKGVEMCIYPSLECKPKNYLENWVIFSRLLSMIYYRDINECDPCRRATSGKHSNLLPSTGKKKKHRHCLE